MSAPWHLAQINIARLRHPTDHPATAAFLAAIPAVNEVADRAPGFVWRLQTESGNATDVRVSDDDLLIVNLSVWVSIEALRAFVYGGDHAEVMRHRREWFERPAAAYQTLWWVPAATTPTAAEGIERLERLRMHGPTADAFTFTATFPPPSGR